MLGSPVVAEDGEMSIYVITLPRNVSRDSIAN